MKVTDTHYQNPATRVFLIYQGESSRKLDVSAYYLRLAGSLTPDSMSLDQQSSDSDF